MRIGGMVKPSEILAACLMPALAIIGALASSWLFLEAFGYDAFEAFEALFNASFKNAKSFGNMLNRTSPLLFTGIAVAYANRGSVFNIGADGQFLCGAIATVWVGTTLVGVPGPILVILMFLAGALAGAIWGAIPGFMKARWGVSEVITTIMFNYIALNLVGYLVRGPLQDTTQAEPQSFLIAEQGFLPHIMEKMHPGFIAGCVVAVIIAILLFKTFLGFEVRAVGLNRIAAKYSGIKVNGTIILSLALSGAIAGLGGMFEVAGGSHYLYETISSGFGYTAIAVAILANNNPVGNGSASMQRAVGVSASFVDVFQGIIIVFVAIASVGYSMKKKRKKQDEEHSTTKLVQQAKEGGKV